jgi:hypothetical protein
MHLHCCSQPWARNLECGNRTAYVLRGRSKASGFTRTYRPLKWDCALPDSLRLASFASATLDMIGAHNIAQTLLIGL